MKNKQVGRLGAYLPDYPPRAREGLYGTPAPVRPTRFTDRATKSNEVTGSNSEPVVTPGPG